MSMYKYLIYSDGGARGNPGPAAIGFIVQDAKGSVVKKQGEVIGDATNNVAEYRAAIAALKKLRSLIGKTRAKKVSVQVRMDSELVVRQLHGLYKVRDAFLKDLFLELKEACQSFGSVHFRHIPRSQNKEADRLVNDALDGILG